MNSQAGETNLVEGDDGIARDSDGRAAARDRRRLWGGRTLPRTSPPRQRPRGDTAALLLAISAGCGGDELFRERRRDDSDTAGTPASGSAGLSCHSTSGASA